MNWARRIQDILLVTLITALIWLYAEGRNVQTYDPGRPIPVRMALPADDLVVVRQTPERFTMEFKGAQSELDHVRRAIATGLTLELDQSEPGTVNVVMSEQLPAARGLASLSVNLTNVDPGMMQVEIDRLVNREIELVFRPREVQLAEDSVSIQPERVRVTLPEGRAADLDDQLMLEVAPTVLRLARAGEAQTVRARVTLPPELEEDPHVRVEPAEVQVAFTIDEREETVTLPSVPVWVMAPPSDLENYQVVLDEGSRVLRDVRVSGPSDMIQRVSEGTLRVVATLRLSSDDLARAVGETATGTVSFELPPSLVVSSETTSVQYTVSRRGE